VTGYHRRPTEDFLPKTAMRPGESPGQNCRPCEAGGTPRREIDEPMTVLVLTRADRFHLSSERMEPMPTDAKRQAVSDLAEMLRNSTAIAVADYRGLKVAEMQVVRRSLRANGVDLHVAKNRLLKIAAEEAQRSGLKPMLEGPTALATISGDEVALAKALQEAFRPFRVVSIRGGLLGDQAIDAASLARMASLPSREVLLAKFAGGIASPLTGFAGVLAGNLRNLAGVLNAVADQKRQTEAA
jgi:large subunit ribosomal protein L10